MQNIGTSQTRNYTIDLLRLIAASAVVVFHLNCKGETTNLYQEAAKFGWLGVPVFFVISGFCIAMAADHSKGAQDFWIRRFFRIFPAYWFSLFVVLLVGLFQYLYIGTNSVAVFPKSIFDIGATLMLLTHPFSAVQTINGVYWSLTVEIFFYATIGLSMLIPKRFRLFFLFATSVLALCPNLFKVQGFFFLADWPAFGIGLALYYVRKMGKRQLLPLSLMVVNLYVLTFEKSLDYSVVAVVTLSLIAISIFRKDIPNNGLSRLGDYSYSIYLVHGPLSIFIHTLINPSLFRQNIFSNVLWDFFLLAFIILFSALMYKHLEVRGIKFGKKATQRLNTIQPILEPIHITILQKDVADKTTA